MMFTHIISFHFFLFCLINFSVKSIQIYSTPDIETKKKKEMLVEYN